MENLSSGSSVFSSELWKDIITWIAKLSKSGEKDAQFYFDSLFDKQVSEKAKEIVLNDIFNWMKQRAEQENDSVAQYYVGKCYLYGDKAPCNPKVGEEFLRKSADNGNGDAYYILGTFYAYGESNIAKDIDKALVCFQKAEELGHERASVAIKIIETTSNQ